MDATAAEYPKRICISSGKGGVGKTSFAVNLAVALAKGAKKVLLIDGDLGLANVDVILGLNVRHTIREVIEEGRNPASALVEIMPGFKVLPASSGVPEMANLAYEEQAFLTQCIESMIGAFDLVLIDTAAGIGDSVLWFNNWAHENIVILSPDPTSMTDAYALIKVLHGRDGKKRFHLMVNSVRSKKEGTAVMDNMTAVLDKFLNIKPLALGLMPYDSAVTNAVRTQKPFFLTSPECRASRALHEIAGKVIGF